MLKYNSRYVISDNFAKVLSLSLSPFPSASMRISVETEDKR